MEPLKIAAIIPAYNPDEKLLKTITGLQRVGFEQIIIVNDGSAEQSSAFFEQAAVQYGCCVVNHAVNLGYGRALKTGFNYFLSQYPDYIGAVSLDADGQHSPEDALRCAAALKQNPGYLVLGTRNFKQQQVPWTNRAGNIITRYVFRFLCGIKVSDTQTGLRGISSELLRHLVRAYGEHFEFCSSILMESKRLDIPIYEVPIQTIYIDGNKSTHFRILSDSARIYALIIRFLLSSLSSFVVDMILFSIVLAITSQFSLVFNTLFATYAARIGSSTFNYKVNRNLVFKKGERNSLLKYIIICVIQATFSYLGVYGLSSLTHISPIWSKVIVDAVLFLISFQVQREWVFRNKQRPSCPAQDKTFVKS